MTQTHRGEGGIGGLSESYCPKCDVSKAFRTGWSVVKQTQQPGLLGGLGNIMRYGQPTAPDSRYCQKCSQIKPQYAAQAGLNPNDPTSQWNMCRCGGA